MDKYENVKKLIVEFKPWNDIVVPTDNIKFVKIDGVSASGSMDSSDELVIAQALNDLDEKIEKLTNLIPQSHVLEILDLETGLTLEQTLNKLLLDGETPTMEQIANIDIHNTEIKYDNMRATISFIQYPEDDPMEYIRILAGFYCDQDLESVFQIELVGQGNASRIELYEI